MTQTKTEEELKKIKTFDNAKDCLDYLTNEAKEGEIVRLDERATAFHLRRTICYKK